ARLRIIAPYVVMLNRALNADSPQQISPSVSTPDAARRGMSSGNRLGRTGLQLRLQRAGAALIALAAFVTYFPSLRGDFISDDYLLLTENRLVRAPDGLFKLWFTTAPIDYWPVPSTTLWLEWRLWGMSPTGYRITNLVLHIVIAWLTWAVLRRLL